MKNNHDKLKKEYSRLYTYLYRYVAFRIPHREDAEDVVSDIFLTALDKLHEYDEDRGNLRQWLTGIARFKILNYWRQKKSVVSLETIFQTPDPTFATKILGKISRQLEVEVILKHVKPEAKALLAMRYQDDMTYKEIADLLDEEPDAVRQRFSRLHRNLRIAFIGQNI